MNAGAANLRATRVANGIPLVNLHKDGLKDGRVEAQEYALRSLLSVSDAASKEAIVEAGCIPLLLAAHQGAPSRHSEAAQEHAVLGDLGADRSDEGEEDEQGRGVTHPHRLPYPRRRRVRFPLQRGCLARVSRSRMSDPTL